MRAVTLSSLFFAAVVGCSASPHVQFTGSAGSSGTGGAGPSASASGSGSGSTASGMGGSGTGGTIGFGGGLAGSGGSTGSGAPGCSAAAQLVYVFALDNNIYSFDPPTKQFTQVATPDCQTTGQPNSMAIDRDLIAWLNYFDFNGGALYTFDLKKKSGCQLAVSLPSAFKQVGMGFSTDTVGGTAETLYVDGIGGGGLGRIDMTSKTLVPIGPFGNDPTLTGQSAELTGTGDAKLYGYFTTSPSVRVAQIDKSNAGILSDKVLTGVKPPSDWAFTFWGGDFYLYAAPGSNATGNSSVIHYSPATQMVDSTYVADVGFKIIGAGVSTCAPLKPPN